MRSSCKTVLLISTVTSSDCLPIPVYDWVINTFEDTVCPLYFKYSWIATAGVDPPRHTPTTTSGIKSLVWIICARAKQSVWNSFALIKCFFICIQYHSNSLYYALHYALYYALQSMCIINVYISSLFVYILESKNTCSLIIVLNV